MRKSNLVWGLAIVLAAGGLLSPMRTADAQAPQAAPAASFRIFYDHNASEVGAQAAAILDNIAANYASAPAGSVRIVGHADAAEAKRLGPENALWLSQRRAGNVRLYLGGRGVPDAAMFVEAYGAKRPKTAAGNEAEDRRVEIEFDP